LKVFHQNKASASDLDGDKFAFGYKFVERASGKAGSGHCIVDAEGKCVSGSKVIRHDTISIAVLRWSL